MGHPGLNNGHTSEPTSDVGSVLAGAAPIIDQAVRQLLEQRLAQVAEDALAELVAEGDVAQLEELARDSLARQLLDLADPPELYFPTVDAWVSEWLLPVYRRSTSGHDRTWCPEWWRHAEAVARLEALWRAWEHLRQDPATGLSVWFRDHADHHMAILLDADGPFKGCDDTHGDRPLQPMRSTPAPDGMFEPEDAAPPPPAQVPTAATVVGAGETRGGERVSPWRNR